MTSEEALPEPRKLNAGERVALEMTRRSIAAAQSYLLALEVQDDPVLKAVTEATRETLRRRIGDLEAQEARVRKAFGIPPGARFEATEAGEVLVVEQGKFGPIAGMSREEILAKREEALKDLAPAVHPVPEDKWLPPEPDGAAPAKEPAP